VHSHLRIANAAVLKTIVAIEQIQVIKRWYFSESPKDFKNIEISEENVRLDARPESTVGPSSCSSSPTNSPVRHSQHYRTLQSYSSPTRKLNIAVTPNHQRDVDQVHSKRWHTAPKEKHKVYISYISYVYNLTTHLTDCDTRGQRKSTLCHITGNQTTSNLRFSTSKCNLRFIYLVVKESCFDSKKR